MGSRGLTACMREMVVKKQSEVDLWVAVLSRAILDLDIPEEYTKAMAWIRSTEESPGSFHFVADAINQEPKTLRYRILRWHKLRRRQLQEAA